MLYVVFPLYAVPVRVDAKPVFHFSGYGVWSNGVTP